MKVNYRGFEIEAERKKSLGGWDNIYYTMIQNDSGWYLADGFSESEDKIRDFITDLKLLVDDYYENPSNYAN
jgi:hypothetical protein